MWLSTNLDVIITELFHPIHMARLAQSVEHETLNLRVVGSSPTLGVMFYLFRSVFRENTVAWPINQ